MPPAAGKKMSVERSVLQNGSSPPQDKGTVHMLSQLYLKMPLVSGEKILVEGKFLYSIVA